MYCPFYGSPIHPLRGAESAGATQSSDQDQLASEVRKRRWEHGFSFIVPALVPLLWMVCGCAGIVLTATGSNSTGSAQLELSSSSLAFGNVVLNTATTKNLTLTSSGSIPLTVNLVTFSGAGFSVSGGAFPATLNPGHSLTLQVRFEPTLAAETSGSIRISSNSSTGGVTVALRGTGVANPILSLSTTSLDFGGVPVGVVVSLPVTLTSTGSSPVTVSDANISGIGFTFSGATFPVTLNPSVSITTYVTCDLLTAGTASGTLTFNSNSTTGRQSAVTLTVDGTSPQHEVTLTWKAPANSPVPVTGYGVYRAVGGSPSFQLLDFSSSATYTDLQVSASTTYVYYVTSVDGAGTESSPSNRATVTIP